MPRFNLSEFFRPSKCLIPTPGLTTEYPICAVCVCVCVYSHIHTHTLPPALKIENTQTTPLSLLLSKIPPHDIHFKRLMKSKHFATVFNNNPDLFPTLRSCETPLLRSMENSDKCRYHMERARGPVRIRTVCIVTPIQTTGHKSASFGPCVVWTDGTPRRNSFDFVDLRKRM